MHFVMSRSYLRVTTIHCFNHANFTMRVCMPLNPQALHRQSVAGVHKCTTPSEYSAPHLVVRRLPSSRSSASIVMACAGHTCIPSHATCQDTCSGPWLRAHVHSLVVPSSSPHFTFEVHNSRAHTTLLPCSKWPRPNHMQVQSTGFPCTRQPHILAGPPASHALNI